MLRNGTPAPSFNLPDSTGSLHTLVDKKITILLFHRGRFCPTTDRFLAAYQDLYPRLKELGVLLYAISTDDAEDGFKLKEGLRLKYPLLCDSNFTVCQQYGLYRAEHAGKVFCEPGMVLIDIDGNVCYSVLSSGPKGLPQPGDVLPVLLFMVSHGGRY